MAMTAAAAAALFGGVVSTGPADGGNFDDDLNYLPGELDKLQLDGLGGGEDCQCELSGATNAHQHLDHLDGASSMHSNSWPAPCEPLLDFGPLMSHDRLNQK